MDGSDDENDEDDNLRLLDDFKAEFMFGLLEEETKVKNLKAGNLDEITNYIKTITNRMDGNKTKEQVLTLLSLLASLKQSVDKEKPFCSYHA